MEMCVWMGKCAGGVRLGMHCGCCVGGLYECGMREVWVFVCGWRVCVYLGVCARVGLCVCGCACARACGWRGAQLCEVMWRERWWRSRKDSLQMGHLSFSSRRRLTSGSSAYSFLWCERMW